MFTTRHRIMDGRLPTHRVDIQIYNGVETGRTYYTPGSVGTYRTSDDNLNPGFRRSMKGNIVMSDCAMTRVTTSITEGVHHYDSGVYHRTNSGDLTPNLQLDLPTLTFNEGNTDMVQATLMKAYANMNSSEIMTGEIMKDLGATLSMLRRPFNGALTLVKKINKSKRAAMKNGETVSRAVANAWLEYRYGWKPLLMDADSIIEACHRIRDKVSTRRLVARAGNSVACSGTRSTPPKYIWALVGCTGNATVSFEKRCSAGVIYSQKEQTPTSQLEQTLGLRPRDFGPTAWECIPYSFVLDWFVNVGDWLQAITPVPGITPIAHWVTTVSSTKTKLEGQIAYPDPQPDLTTVYTGTHGSIETETFSYTRECNQPMQFTPVLKRKNLSRLQQLDGAALLLGKVIQGLGSTRH